MWVGAFYAGLPPAWLLADVQSVRLHAAQEVPGKVQALTFQYSIRHPVAFLYILYIL